MKKIANFSGHFPPELHKMLKELEAYNHLSSKTATVIFLVKEAHKKMVEEKSK